MRTWSYEHAMAMQYLGQEIWRAFKIWRHKRRALRYETWRICEFHDYATSYGEFDHKTPLGTVSSFGYPLVEEQQIQILGLRRALKERGRDPDDPYGFKAEGGEC